MGFAAAAQPLRHSDLPRQSGSGVFFFNNSESSIAFIRRSTKVQKVTETLISGHRLARISFLMNMT